MKILISSTDLEDLEQVVKRLVCACIPCAVCKDPASSHLSVWVQQDADFPLALRVVMNRDKCSHLPHWARVYEFASPANTESRPTIQITRPKRPTRMGTQQQVRWRCPTPQTEPAIPTCRPLLGLTR